MVCGDKIPNHFARADALVKLEISGLALRDDPRGDRWLFGEQIRAQSDKIDRVKTSRTAFQIRDDGLIDRLANDIVRFKRAATVQSNAKGCRTRS